MFDGRNTSCVFWQKDQGSVRRRVSRPCSLRYCHFYIRRVSRQWCMPRGEARRRASTPPFLARSRLGAFRLGFDALADPSASPGLSHGDPRRLWSRGRSAMPSLPERIPETCTRLSPGLSHGDPSRLWSRGRSAMPSLPERSPETCTRLSPACTDKIPPRPALYDRALAPETYPTPSEVERVR